METESNIQRNTSIIVSIGLCIVAAAYILICFTVSFLFEGTQYIVGFGISDIDDLIMNTFGGIIGALLYFVFLKKVDKIANAKIATLAFLSVFGICGLLFLYLYQPNMLPAQIKLILAYLR